MYLSDKSYANLKSRLGIKTKSARGLDVVVNLYILHNDNWYDTRPAYIRATDAVNLKLNRHLIFRDIDKRRTYRPLSLSDAVLQRLTEIGWKLGVFGTSSSAVAGRVLEAIGLNYISSTPMDNVSISTGRDRAKPTTHNKVYPVRISEETYNKLMEIATSKGCVYQSRPSLAKLLKEIANAS